MLNRTAPGPHCANRLFEWAATAMMLGIAVCVVLTPATIEMGAFRFLREAGLTAVPVAIVFGAFGALRAVALWANGYWQPGGARARMLCASAAAFMWFQMLVALLALMRVTGTLSVGIPVYAVLTACELISCYRAAYDEVRRSRA